MYGTSLPHVCMIIREGIHTHLETYILTCIHIHTHLETYILTCIHTYLHTYIHTHTHAYIHTYTGLGPSLHTLNLNFNCKSTRVYACWCACMYVSMYVWQYICVFVLTFIVSICVCMDLGMHVCVYVCMHTRTYIHTGIGDEGASALARALAIPSCSLTCVYLSGNR